MSIVGHRWRNLLNHSRHRSRRQPVGIFVEPFPNRLQDLRRSHHKSLFVFLFSLRRLRHLRFIDEQRVLNRPVLQSFSSYSSFLKAIHWRIPGAKWNTVSLNEGVTSKTEAPRQADNVLKLRLKLSFDHVLRAHFVVRRNDHVGNTTFNRAGKF